MASIFEKITQIWPKRAKGCALSQPRQYFSWGARKKILIFLQKNLVDGGSNPGIFCDKPLPYRLSHRGVVIDLNLKLGATLISLARFLVAPNYVWVPLYISQSPCVCVCEQSLIVKKKISKKSRGIEPQMSAWVATTLPSELFRTFNLSYYFTKKML